VPKAATNPIKKSEKKKKKLSIKGMEHNTCTTCKKEIKR
jgi:hypothetical protein